MAQKDSEWGLLCCIVKDPSIVAECEMAGLAECDFFSPLYRYLYARMFKLYTDGSKTIDEVSLRTSCDAGLDVLLRSEQVEKNRLFTAMFTNHVSPSNASAFIDDIMELSMQAAINEKLNDFNRDRNNNLIITSEQLITGMEDVLQGAYQRLTSERPTVIGGGSNLFEQVRSREPAQLTGLATPWPTLNHKISGLGPGTIMLWVSPTGTGKTTSMINLMNKIAITDKIPALFIGTEMNYEEIMLRSLACRAGVKERDLRLNQNWQTSAKTVEQVRKACYDMDSTDTYHYLCMPEFSLSKIRGHAIRMQMRYGIKLLIFDYVSEPEDADTKSRKEWQNLSSFVWRMKGLAIKLNIPIVIVGQTPIITARDYMTLDDIAMAKYMSFHCDNIIGVINKNSNTLASEKALNIQNIGNQKMYILKARHGGEEAGSSGHRYINMNYERPILRITEGLFPPDQRQGKK